MVEALKQILKGGIGMNPYIGHDSQLYGVEEHRLVGGKGDGFEGDRLAPMAHVAPTGDPFAAAIPASAIIASVAALFVLAGRMGVRGGLPGGQERRPALRLEALQRPGGFRHLLRHRPGALRLV